MSLPHSAPLFVPCPMCDLPIVLGPAAGRFERHVRFHLERAATRHCGQRHDLSTGLG